MIAWAQPYPSPTFNTVTLQTPLTAANGGTGVNNGSNNITLTGNLTTHGGHALAFTTTGVTNVTLPTSGTLLNTITGVTPGANSNITSLSNVSSIGGIPIYSALQYGAVCDGSTDDSSAIQSAISAAQSAGGGTIVLPPGKVCAIASSLEISASNVGILCPNGGDNPNTFGSITGYPFTSSCTLKWIGSLGGSMVQIVSPHVSTSSNPIQGDSIIGVQFDGNAGLAANGLDIQTESAGNFKNLSFLDFAGGYAIDLNVIGVTNTNFNPLATASSQWNVFQNVFVQDLLANASTGLRLGSFDGGGSLTVNASENVFINTHIEVGASGGATAEGILFDGADTNRFYTTAVSEYADTAPAVDFSISQNGSNYFSSGANSFYGLVAGSEIIARGQTTFPSCTSSLTTSLGSEPCTSGDQIYDLDYGNGTQPPVVEPGAQLMWRTGQGVSGGQTFGQIAAGGNATDTLGAASAITNETLRIRNSASDNIILDNSSGVSAWGINLDSNSSTADLRINPIAGTSGTVLIAGALNTTGNDALLYNNSSGQSIPSGVSTTITGWTKVDDRIGAQFNASTGVYTAPATGYYNISAGLLFNNAASTVGNQYLIAVIAKGVNVCTGEEYSQNTSSSIPHAASVSCVVSLSAGQTALIQANQNTGSALTLSSSGAATYVSVSRIP